METRAHWGAGYIAGLGPKVMEAENQADEAYSLAIDSALGVENNKFTRLFKERASKQARETIISKTGLARFEITQEGKDFNQDDRVPSYETQFNPIKKTQSIQVTKEEREDRDFDVQDKLDEMRDLKIDWMGTQDEDGFSIFNYAFTAQASLPDHLTFYADGKPLCDTGHPIKASTTSNTTQSNKSSTAIPLTEVNLSTGRQGLRRQNDDRDLPMRIATGRIILLVPDSLEELAVRIAKSTKRSNTANNDLNVFDGVVTVISTKLINSQQTNGSDTAWFLIDSMRSPLIFLNREGFVSDIWEKKSNKNIIYDAETRYHIGNKSWRGVWGSAGA